MEVLPFSFMKKEELKLVNIGSSDIEGGNEKLILGLLWYVRVLPPFLPRPLSCLSRLVRTIIYHYQIAPALKNAPAAHGKKGGAREMMLEVSLPHYYVKHPCLTCLLCHSGCVARFRNTTSRTSTRTGWMAAPCAPWSTPVVRCPFAVYEYCRRLMGPDVCSRRALGHPQPPADDAGQRPQERADSARQRRGVLGRAQGRRSMRSLQMLRNVL